MVYTQQLDPLQGMIFWSKFWSTVLAALPVIVLFWLLVPRRWLAPKAGAAGALAAILVAVLIYNMPVTMAISSFAYGAAFGLLPVGWTIFNAMLLYNITVETGRFNQIRQSISDLSGDARIQAMLIGFSFGAFLEGAAGGGTPVAICGAIMVGLGFHPFLAAVLCLIANTSPVAYGGLGTPLIVLGDVTGLDVFKLSIMAGRQLPWISFFVPLYMIKVMCSWRKTWEVWPALVVSGGSFAVFQFVFAHYESLYPMTDIGGGLFSLIVTAIFLKFWKPKEEFRFDTPPPPSLGATPPAPKSSDPHAAEAEALLGGAPAPASRDEVPLTGSQILGAWMPFLIMSVLLMLTGIIRQKENAKPKPPEPGQAVVEKPKDEPKAPDPWIKPGPVSIFGDFTTNYLIQVPFIHRTVTRDPTVFKDEHGNPEKPESAIFNFPWLTAPGTAVMFSAIISMVMLRMNRAQIGRVLHRTCVQMKVPIPTIAFMLGLSYVTRYAGMDATLGYAFVATGFMYPFFAAIIGWLGVFLTGTDAGSNALFGSLQRITATLLYDNGEGPISYLNERQTQHLICTANSTGGVMGKMIDAQSICVATAATNQIGKEADIFKAVVWHSIILASIVGAMTLLQAYVFPFTLMVPK